MRSALPYYLLLIRPVNLGIMLLTQVVFMAHASHYNFTNLRMPGFGLVILAVLCTAAAGYVINDILDIEEDSINVPETRIVARYISLKNARIYYFLLAIAGVVAGFMCSYTLGILCVCMNVLLYFYSADLKGTVLWGNLLIALMSGVVVFTAGSGVYTVSDGFFAEFALLAFLVSLSREMVKDAEDMHGDVAAGRETLPVVFGLARTKFLAAAALLLMCSELAYLCVRYGNMGFVLHCILLCGLPVVYVFWKLAKASERRHFSHLSATLKLLMFAGLCSVLWL